MPEIDWHRNRIKHLRWADWLLEQCRRFTSIHWFVKFSSLFLPDSRTWSALAQSFCIMNVWVFIMMIKVANTDIWVRRNVQLGIWLSVPFIWRCSVPLILMNMLSSFLTGIWWNTLLKTSTIHSRELITLVKILLHPCIFGVMSIISWMIRCVGMKISALCNLWLHYPVKENSVFGSLKIRTNRNIGVLLLLFKLLSVRKIDINCCNLLLLSSVIM